MAEQRWKAIDLYKGILIILVVAGHIGERVEGSERVWKKRREKCIWSH